MKPAPFEYVRPRSLDEALSRLADYGGDAKPLAGGQSLIPAMNFRLSTPSVLIDLNDVAELNYIRRGAGVVLGGMTRQSELERSALIAERVPLVAQAMPHIAHPAIRNRGTVGGSLAHADPAAELPAVMLALGAEFGVSSRKGVRRIPAAAFFTGLFSTAIQPGELLTEILIPDAPEPSGFAFQEVSRRRGDFALVGVAASVQVDDDASCSSAKIALFSVSDRPVLAESAARSLIGQPPTLESIRAAAELAGTEDIDPTSDIHASARYRRQLAKVLTRRALERAFATIRKTS